MPKDHPEKCQINFLKSHKKPQKATKSHIIGTINALYYHIFHIAFHLEQEILTTGCSEMDSGGL